MSKSKALNSHTLQKPAVEIGGIGMNSTTDFNAMFFATMHDF